jgi:hypothetical protein
MALAAAVRAVAADLDEIFPTGDLLKIKLDDGSVYACFRAQDSGERVTATIVYSDPSAYPHSGALVMADGDPAVASKLDGLAERFQDRAPLPLVLSKVGGRRGGGGRGVARRRGLVAGSSAAGQSPACGSRCLRLRPCTHACWDCAAIGSCGLHAPVRSGREKQLKQHPARGSC